MLGRTRPVPCAQGPVCCSGGSRPAASPTPKPSSQPHTQPRTQPFTHPRTQPAAVGASSACGRAGACEPPRERRHRGTSRMPTRHHLRHSSIPLPPSPRVLLGWAPWQSTIWGIGPQAHAHGPPCPHGGAPCPCSGPCCLCGTRPVPLAGWQTQCHPPCHHRRGPCHSTSQAPKMAAGFIHPKRWPQP